MIRLGRRNAQVWRDCGQDSDDDDDDGDGGGDMLTVCLKTDVCSAVSLNMCWPVEEFTSEPQLSDY